LYRVDASFIFLISAFVITTLATFLTFKFPHSYPKSLQLLAWISGISIGAWVLTPHGAGYWAGTQMILALQLRYAIVLVPLIFILLISLITPAIQVFVRKSPGLESFYSQLQRQFYQYGQPERTGQFIGVSIILVLVLAAIQLTTYKLPQGLPGYNSILFTTTTQSSPHQSTQVYQWVQDNLHDQMIYAVGPRPYGLYGFPFSNRVISGGSPATWNYQVFRAEQEKIKANYLVLSVDPFTGNVSSDFQYLLANPQTYQPVYGDSLSRVFKIAPNSH
jgi:hypothetical protein